jgi:hypothetical protein
MIEAELAWAVARESSLDCPRDGSFSFLPIGDEEKRCSRTDAWGTQVAEASDKQPPGDKPPEPVLQGPSGRVTATVVSLAALAIIGAATANSLPSFDLALPNLDRFSLPKFDLTLPKFDVAMPKFDHFSWPSFGRTPPKRVAAPPKPPVLVPDPFVHAALRGIQMSQQQHTEVLASLTQNSESQQADLRRISRQLYALTAQVNALQGAVGPLTTSSISHSNARVRFVRKSHKPIPAIPKPVGPVSIGGAPLSPAPAAGSGV